MARLNGWWLGSDAKEQFLSTVEQGEKCWRWTGTTDKNGYGRLTVDGRSMPASKMAHWLFIGPVPSGHVVMHDCDNPPCVNPVHLRSGTQAENQRERVRKGRIGRLHPQHRSQGHVHRPFNWFDGPHAQQFFLMSVSRGTDEVECWHWTGATKGTKYGGHGIVSVRGRHMPAHRAAYLLFNGPIPEGAHVLHQCDNPPCVNPAHLTIGDHAQNMHEASERKQFQTGDQHWTKRMPDRIARGDRHRSRTAPQSIASGEDHWTHRDRAKALRNAQHLRKKP